MKHGATIESVKSTCDRLETSPSKHASNSNPVYHKMSGKKGGKGGFKSGSK